MTQWAAAVAVALAVVGLGRPPRTVRLGSSASTSAAIRSRPGWSIAALIGTALVAARVSPVEMFLAVGSAVCAQRLVRRHRETADRAATATAVVEVTYALAAELRAGRTTAESLLAVTDLAGPLTTALRAAHGAVAVGADAAAELAAAASVSGAERLAPVAAAWAVATASGGQVAIVLERLAAAMDDEDELRREIDAALAGPKATMVLLAGLPVLGLLLGQSVGAHPLQLLVHHAIGWGLLTSAICLDVVGVLVMRAIVSRAQAP